MTKNIALTLFFTFILSASLLAQDIRWTKYEYQDVEEIFEGYDSYDVVDYDELSGTKQITANLTLWSWIYFSGPTPYQKVNFLLDEKEPKKLSSIKPFFQRLKENSLKPKTSKSRLNFDMSLFQKKFVVIDGFRNDYGTHISQTFLVKDKDKGLYMIQEYIHNNGKKYFDIDFDKVDMYYDVVNPQDLNPFDLDAYSALFAADIVVFHKATIQGTMFKKYLSFGQLPDGIIGLANGMSENCVNKVTINPDEWNRANNWKRLWVVYHEIAHDIYNVQHGTGGVMMDPEIPTEVNFLDFFMAREELLSYLITIDPDSVFCDF